MKKIIFSFILAAAAMNTNAQLVVDSLGRVGIGIDEMPHSLLSVGDSGRYDADIVYKGNGKQYGRFYLNNTDDANTTYGSFSFANNLSGSCCGAKSIASGSNNLFGSQVMVGLSGLAGRGNTAVGVFGGLYMQPVYTLTFAGVYGSESGSTPNFGNYSDKYAGFFNGKVRVTNGIYATVLSPSASASPSGQNGMTVLSDRGESVTDKLSQVQTLQFLRYDPMEEAGMQRTVPDDLDIDNTSPDDLNLDSLAESTGNAELERYLSAIQYGLDADQLKAVYPELVYEDANGNVSINYVEMIPLLVQSIRELKAELAELVGTRRGASASGEQIAETTSIKDNVSDIDMVRMDQNKPNPFSESTVITLNIPDNAQAASIFIFDMSGKQIQSLSVTERGETNITVYAAGLTAGMYIYTLVVDGKVSVTRRMIVTK